MLRQHLRAHGAVVSSLFGHDAISDAVRHFSKLLVQRTADCGCVSCQVELDLDLARFSVFTNLGKLPKCVLATIRHADSKCQRQMPDPNHKFNRCLDSRHALTESPGRQRTSVLQ